MIYTLGESLLDIIIKDLNHVTAHPGGAMLNAAISMQRAGLQTSLISELGNDKAGELILNSLNTEQINIQYITVYSNNETSLAIAFLDKEKKPEYTFKKSYPKIRKLPLPPNFTNNDFLLFGSLYSLDFNLYPQIDLYLQKAKQAETTIIYDPNIRMSEKIKNPDLKKILFRNMSIAEIIKGSDEDFNAIFPGKPIEELNEEFLKINPEALFIITQGKNGASAFYKNKIFHEAAKPVKTISTVGAGDGFNAGIIAYMENNNIIFPLSGKEILSLLKTGNKFASAVCSSQENYIPLKSK